MRKTILFIAMSLDGYIADVHGGISWLEGQEPGENDMTSYDQFIQIVDTVIMGAGTYRQLTAELSSDEWPYPNLTSYVITHSPKESSDTIRFTDDSPCRLIRRLKQEDGNGIRLFDTSDKERKLKLIKTMNYNGITDLVYERR